MNINEALEELEKQFDISKLFDLGVFNRFSNSERIYLDEFDLKGMDLFLFILNYIHKKLEIEFEDRLFVCLLAHTEDDLGQFPAKILKNFSKFDMKIPKQTVYRKRYVEEDMWFCHYLFFEESKSELLKYIWGILARNFTHIQPHLAVDVFFISHDLKIFGKYL